MVEGSGRLLKDVEGNLQGLFKEPLSSQISQGNPCNQGKLPQAALPQSKCSPQKPGGQPRTGTGVWMKTWIHVATTLTGMTKLLVNTWGNMYQLVMVTF